MAPETRSMTKRKKTEGEMERDEKKENAPPPLQFPGPLPQDLYVEIAKHVHESEALAFVMTCRGFLDAMTEVLQARENDTSTRLELYTFATHYYEEHVPVSEDWIKWAFSMKWEWFTMDGYDPDQYDYLTWMERRSVPQSTWRKLRPGLKGRFLTYHAAYNGYEDVLGWLRSQGCSYDGAAYGGAGYAGRIKVIKYLKSEGVPIHNEASYRAAERGHIKVLKYLKSEGAPFDEGTCYWAAAGGQLEVLKWLRSKEVNCPWDIQECLQVAKENKREETREWITTHL